MLSGLLRLLLPYRCGGCGSLGSLFCATCRSRLRRPRPPLCARCGRELAYVNEGCGCRRRLRSLTAIRSAAMYEGPLERAIHRFKYEGRRGLDRDLAGLLAGELAVLGQPAEMVVAVPLHPARQRSRGYNQSELLASRLRECLRVRSHPGRLIRLRDTPPQVGLDRVRRRSNVSAAFAWRGPALAGAGVLLVDDVATTGATLEACAEALRRAGAGSVIGLTLARTQL